MIAEDHIVAENVAQHLAVVRGEPVTQLPHDLYIPPHALRVFLDTFSGPLDLLLYLIKRQNLDILDIPIAEISRQYMHYIELMQEVELEIAAEYLVMAAMLAEIKTRLLLPRPASVNLEEDDPRAELVRRLQEYERIKQASQQLDALPQREREIFWASAQIPELPAEPTEFPPLELAELVQIMQEIMQRVALRAHHAVKKETLSIHDRMQQILVHVGSGKSSSFISLFSLHEGRLGVVVTFIAILELLRQALIEMVQSEPFAEIQVRGVSR